MTAPRWSAQDTYASAIESAADDVGVPRSLAYGLIAQESSFNPNAMRQEPAYVCKQTGQTGDASYGLMQVLYCTALGTGFAGAPTDLLDVDQNLAVGMPLLSGLIASHGGDIPAALSAYNGGDRPSLGYGTRKTDGTFANQAYVNNIVNNAAYFDQYLADRDGTSSDGSDASTDPGSSSSDVLGLLVLLGAIAAGGYAVARNL